MCAEHEHQMFLAYKSVTDGVRVTVLPAKLVAKHCSSELLRLPPGANGSQARTMEKRVKRSEVNITVGAKSPTKTPLKEGLFPNADALAQKYGVVDPSELVQPPPQVVSSGPSNREVELLRKLDDKNRKIDQLCTLLEALEPTPGVDAERIQKLLDDGIDENVDFRDAKIVNLAKKSHRLTMQLNKEKSIADKLNQQILDLQKHVGSLQQDLTSAKASAGKGEAGAKVYNRNAATAEPTVEDHLATIAGLQRDMKENSKQIDELKRKLAQSVEENKQLSRTLQKELGEGVTLEQAVSGGWRGRAQQIIMLKSKVQYRVIPTYVTSIEGKVLNWTVF
jgi:cell division septum initiation protein DivIVA